MKCFLVVVILLQLQRNLYVQVRGQYSIPTEVKQWTEAIKTCTVATPKLDFSAGTKVVNLNFDLTEEVWIGYFQNKTRFQYIGCQKQQDISNAKQIQQNSPGLCLSACQGDRHLFVGLQDKMCYCVNYGMKPQHEDTCTTRCYGQKGVACGEQTTVSLYSTIQNDVNALSDVQPVGDCLRIEKKRSNWFGCVESLLALCAKDNAHVVVVDKSTSFSWIEASTKCFKNRSFPVSINNFPYYNDTSPAWSGVLRSDVVYKYNLYEEARHLHHDDIKFMYLNNKGQVNFAFGNVTKKFLCITETSFSTTTTKMMKPDKQGPAVVVGISVSVVLIVGIVVVVIIILKRRSIMSCKTKQKEEDVTKHEESKTNDYQEIPEISYTNGSLRYSDLQKDDKYDHTYHTVNPRNTDTTGTPVKAVAQTNYSLAKSAAEDFPDGRLDGAVSELNDDHLGHAYFVLDKQYKTLDNQGLYNVTDTLNANSLQTSANVYNTLDNKNATYDHLHQSMACFGENRREPDSTYDTKYSVINTRTKIFVDAGDVYNKVSPFDDRAAGKTTRVTDNVYGLSDNSNV